MKNKRTLVQIAKTTWMHKPTLISLHVSWHIHPLTCFFHMLGYFIQCFFQNDEQVKELSGEPALKEKVLYFRCRKETNVICSC